MVSGDSGMLVSKRNLLHDVHVKTIFCGATLLQWAGARLHGDWVKVS